MRAGLRRYWFRFDGDAAYGYGVTAISREDALSQLGRVFDGPLPALRVETEDIDVSTLDPGHVLPNMGDPSIRGIWFPLCLASRGLRDDRSLAGTGPLHGRDIEDPWHLNEIARRRRVRIDAERSLGANLSEGLALIEFLSGFTGVCRR